MSIIGNWQENFKAVRDAIEATPAFGTHHQVMPPGVSHHPMADLYAYVALVALAAGEHERKDGEVSAEVSHHVHVGCDVTGQEIAKRLTEYLRRHGLNVNSLG